MFFDIHPTYVVSLLIMGQQEVFLYLKKKGWKTKAEIADELKDFNIASINQSLKRLVKGKFIELKKCPYLKHGYLYRIRQDDTEKVE